MLFYLLTLQLKVKYISSEEIRLTDEHMGLLDGCIAKFRASNPDNREIIIEEAADVFQSTWREDVEFDRDEIIEVRELSVKLRYSERVLAYSQASMWKT
jgi:hypothetical protein